MDVDRHLYLREDHPSRCAELLPLAPPNSFVWSSHNGQGDLKQMPPSLDGRTSEFTSRGGCGAAQEGAASGHLGLFGHALTLMRVEIPLPQADGTRGDFHQFIIADVGQ